MKRKLLIIFTFFIVSIVGILGIVKLGNILNKETKVEEKIIDSNEIQASEKDTKDEEDENDKNDDATKLEETTESINTPTEEEKEISSSSSTNKNNNSNNTKNETKSSTSNIENSKTKEITKVSGPWEAWGMTENEYYNEPYPKGARIDYSVDDYGSEKACMNACTAKGDEYYGYVYSCDLITSASGKFLGVMLDLEEVTY